MAKIVSSEFRKMLGNEFEFLNQFKHDHILKPIDFWTGAELSSTGTIYRSTEDATYSALLMPLCSNGNLETIIQDGPISEDMAMPLFKQIVNSVEYIHS